MCFPRSIPDCYRRLGLEPNASLDRVKKAYHQLALQHHPDVVPVSQRQTAEKNFKQLSQAYNHIVQGDLIQPTQGRRHADWSRTGIHHQTGPPGRVARALSPWAIALFFSVPVMLAAVRINWSLQENEKWIKAHTGRQDGLLNPATNNFLSEDHQPKMKSSKTYSQICSSWSKWT
mmetsp:Transcript_22164/g.48640  ORF Transcript_22164/g.48640 Transcript_22164/m.48640 type:complete len:175 (-) Transcript_22164:359-883(-)